MSFAGKTLTKDTDDAMPKFTPPVLKGLLKKPGRHPDVEAKGLYFRTVGDGKAYWVYRFRLAGREREMSLGPYPETSLKDARVRHAGLRTQVLNKTDPMAGKRGAPVASSEKPTFGAMADDYVATHEGSWRNSKHRWQWTQTLTQHCSAIREKPVDEVSTSDVLAVLKPIWTKTPETASRLRGRIESVIDAARALNHIPEDRANPARWKGHLDKLLPRQNRLARGHHAAMPYADVPNFVIKLSKIDATASWALRLTILTAARSGETLNMTWKEVNLNDRVWTVPAERMKMGKPHDVPLSDQAMSILREQEAKRRDNPFVFPGRPQRPLSNMSMAMLMRRVGAGDFTVHGFRSAARSWMADQGVPFELAEATLAHTVGNAVVQAYQRSSMLERRRPVLQAWADFVTGKVSGA
jgi:integrase